MGTTLTVKAKYREWKGHFCLSIPAVETSQCSIVNIVGDKT